VWPLRGAERERFTPAGDLRCDLLAQVQSLPVKTNAAAALSWVDVSLNGVFFPPSSFSRPPGLCGHRRPCSELEDHRKRYFQPLPAVCHVERLWSHISHLSVFAIYPRRYSTRMCHQFWGPAVKMHILKRCLRARIYVLPLWFQLGSLCVCGRVHTWTQCLCTKAFISRLQSSSYIYRYLFLYICVYI